MRMIGVAALLSVVLAAPAIAEEQRELGAHQHGHGTFNVAVEGPRVSMELEVPGADIVGFEHPAETPEQKAAVERAAATLALPLSLFKVPSAAACRVLEASVRVQTEEHEREEAKGGAGAKEAKPSGHSEFYAEYVLECTAPHALSSIEFDYFRAFPGAQELDVTVVTDKGQNKFEVTRANPRLALGGSM